MKHILLIFSIAFFFLASCSGTVNRSIVSTKVASVPPHKALGKVEAKDCGAWVLWYPVSVPNYNKMYNSVLEQSDQMGGDAIIDYQVRETSSTNAFFLYMRYCYAAVGTSVKFISGDGTSAWDAAPSEGSSVWDAPPPGMEQKQEQKQETKSVWD